MKFDRKDLIRQFLTKAFLGVMSAACASTAWADRGDQIAEAILKAPRERGFTTQAYKDQAQVIMNHYGIGSRDIPCDHIDEIDIYGKGDGVINPHYFYPAADQDEWRKVAYRFSAELSKVNLRDCVFMDGKCIPSKDFYQLGYDANGYRAWVMKDWVKKRKDVVFCTAYDVSGAVSAGSGKRLSSLQGEGTLYPKSLSYEDTTGYLVKYARECKSQKIDRGAIAFESPNASGVNTSGISCRGVSGKKQIGPRDVEYAMGRFLKVRSLGFSGRNPFANDPFYPRGTRTAGAVQTAGGSVAQKASW